ncbi:Gtr1/RagA G protein conserved region-domain-containing protein [Lipomyces japonicus]|uniref:Gtr1/RagA G protein conserved region-domain-containing protein n=1 Tax=Lipomyces japonicus TaxID=56871 RepID=UPI0034CF38EE
MALVNIDSHDRQQYGVGNDFLPFPKIVMMGLRRGGKSSICQVMFHNMQPLDTLYIESTTAPTSSIFSSFIDFEVVELPGQIDVTEAMIDADRIFANVGALIYVIDSQDEYINSLANLNSVIVHAVRANPAINIEVFIHKVDGLSEDFRLDAQRDITQRVTDELLDVGLVNLSISFHLTSIFDHSIYEAFSRVVQKLIPQMATLENLLNVLCQHSGIEKAFLFDIGSKIFVATDSSPMDIPTYEICTYFIDITVDMNTLYHQDQPLPEPTASITAAEDAGVSQAGTVVIGHNNNDNNSSNNSTLHNKLPQQQKLQLQQQEQRQQQRRRRIGSTSRLSNGVILYLQQMVKGLALVCLMRKENTPKMALVEYNVEFFRDALEHLWMVG